MPAKNMETLSLDHLPLAFPRGGILPALAHIMNHGSSPPPRLTRGRNIQLPSLLPDGAPVPDLHPLLRMGAVPLCMSWDTRAPLWLSPTSQPPSAKHSATYPALTSMAIRVDEASGVLESQTIVVFPSVNSIDGTVTVEDVLLAVNGFVVARHGAGGAQAGGDRPRLWMGLMPSTAEREVWVLHIS